MAIFVAQATQEIEPVRQFNLAVPHAPVWNYADLFAHPQAAARGLRVHVTDPEGKPAELVGSPFHISGSAAAPATAPPELGQDTDQVLQQLLGLESARLAALRRAGVI